MLRAISGEARRLDEWLQDRFGRPYTLMLTFGLIIELVRHLIEAPHLISERRSLVGLAFSVVLQAALLIHQTGQLSHHLKAHAGRRRRSAPGSTRD